MAYTLVMTTAFACFNYIYAIDQFLKLFFHVNNKVYSYLKQLKLAQL